MFILSLCDSKATNCESTDFHSIDLFDCFLRKKHTPCRHALMDDFHYGFPFLGHITCCFCVCLAQDKYWYVFNARFFFIILLTMLWSWVRIFLECILVVSGIGGWQWNEAERSRICCMCCMHGSGHITKYRCVTFIYNVFHCDTYQYSTYYTQCVGRCLYFFRLFIFIYLSSIFLFVHRPIPTWFSLNMSFHPLHTHQTPSFFSSLFFHLISQSASQNIHRG